MIVIQKNFFDYLFIWFSRLLTRFYRSELPAESSTQSGPGLWLHGASAGELQVLISTFREAKKLTPELVPIWSFTSPNGAQLLDRLLTPAERLYSFNLVKLSDIEVAEMMRHLNVKVLALCEKDRYAQLLWPAFEAEIPVIGIDTRFCSGRPLKAFFARDKLALNFADVFTSRQGDYQAALTLGLNNCRLTSPPKIDVALDRFAAEQNLSTSENLVDEKTLVIGSLHLEELENIIKALPVLLAESSISVRIYPKDVRKPEVIQEVERALKELLPDNLLDRVKVDTGFGGLFQVYRNCWAAIIGGSFYAKGGGHNFFESLVWDRPTFVGPFNRNWHDEVAESKAKGLLTVCAGSAELGSELRKLNQTYQRPDAYKWFASRPRPSFQYAERLKLELE